MNASSSTGRTLVALFAILAALCVPAPSAYAAEGQSIGGSAQLQAQTIGVDDYPQNLKDAPRDSLIDPWRFYNRECVSFVAWRLNNDNGIAFSNFYGGVKWGNAYEWGDAARKLGITVDNRPAVGAVAWWDNGSLGHVAWVKSVQSGSVTIEEYNYGNDGRYYTRTIPTTNPTGYIHIQDLQESGDPVGYFDECFGEDGSIVIRGWSVDPDSPDRPVAIHVYVGGPAGVGNCYTQDINGEILLADQPRGDLPRASSFQRTIVVGERGDQPVYVYAINNEEGENPLLIGCPKNAVIGSQTHAVPMHRLYNPNSGEHFYTSDDEERASIVELGWVYEGLGWTAPHASQTPVYRLYNPNAGEHHYTISCVERDWLKDVGWEYEGIGWYSDDGQAVPLYRQYNPNAFANNHNYTASREEHEQLIGLGWKDEGIAWHGLLPA